MSPKTSPNLKTNLKAKTKTLAMGLLLLAAITPAQTAAATEEKLPAGMPALGLPKPLPTPLVDQSRTREGLTVWVVKRPSTPKTTVLLMVRGGEASDPPGLIGLSDLLTSTLNQGTHTRSAPQLSDELQSVGAAFNSEDTRDATYMSLNGLGDGTSKMIELMSDMAQHASFPDAEVALAKTNLRNSLESALAQASFQGQLAFAKALFGDHPYSVEMASAEVIDKLTPAALRDTYQRRFRPERALLIVAGDVDAARVKKDVARVFAGWKGAGAAEPPVAPLPSTAAQGRRIFLLDRPGSVQSHVEIGGLAPLRNDPQYYPLLLANQIYGGSFTSRLMSNVREEKGYSYSPFSRLEETLLTGVFKITADVRNEVTAPALVETFYELDRMWTVPVTDKELERAKRLAAGQFAFLNQIGAAQAYTLAINWSLGLPPEEVARYVSKLNAVTAAEVQRAGARVFPSPQQTIVIVGDKPKIAPSLAHLGTIVDIK